MRLYETEDGIALEGTDEDGNRATATKVCEKILAQKIEAAKQNISTQLAKLGNTIFQCSDFKNELGEIYFSRVSELNELRRSLVDTILKERLKNSPCSARQVFGRIVSHIPKRALITREMFLMKRRRRFTGGTV